MQTVALGGRQWLTEDLDVDRFRNGDAIPQAATDDEWRRAGATKQPAWCFFGNDPKKGRLYNWWAVNDPRGLAPVGSHVPSDAEWKALVDAVGGMDDGGALRRPVGASPKALGMAEGGSRQLGVAGFSQYESPAYWTSTSSNATDAWSWFLFSWGQVKRMDVLKERGGKVRCVAQAGSGAALPAPAAAKAGPKPPTAPAVDPVWGPVFADPLKFMEGRFENSVCRCGVKKAEDGGGKFLRVVCSSHSLGIPRREYAEMEVFRVVSHRKSSVGACEDFLLEAQAKTWRSDDSKRGKKDLQISLCQPSGAAVLSSSDMCHYGGALAR